MRSLRVIECAPCALVGGDLLDVSGVLDGAAPVEAAVVAGDLDAVGDDAHGGVAGADHHALADVGGGHRVAVGVEAHAGLLADDGRDDRVGVEAAWWQRSQPWGFHQQPLARALAGGGVDAVVGDLVAPLGGLGADVVERAEGAAVEERVADVLDGALDAALGLGVAHGGSGGLEQVVTCEREQTRVELHRGADVVQDGALEVVVEDFARHAPEELQGAAVHQQEGLGLLVEREVHEQGARPAQHHRERRQGPQRRAAAHLAEAAPVHLGLLAGLQLDAQVRLLAARGAYADQPPAEHGDAVGVAAFLDLLEEPRRGHLRVGRQPLQQVRLERVEPGGGGGRVLGLGLVGDRATHHRVVDVEAPSDGLDLPSLAEHQAPHLGAHLGSDHREPEEAKAMRRLAASKSPMSSRNRSRLGHMARPTQSTLTSSCETSPVHCAQDSRRHGARPGRPHRAQLARAGGTSRPAPPSGARARAGGRGAWADAP